MKKNIHFWTDTLGKVMNFFISHSYELNSSTTDSFGFK